MKWALGVVVSLIALVSLITLIGSSLPVGHEASRRAEFARSPQDVFALLSDAPNYTRWWPEHDAKVVVVERVPPTRIVTRIVENADFGGTWTIEIAPTATGSRVTITERGEIYNVIFRALARYVFGYTSTMDTCLAAARQHLGG